MAGPRAGAAAAAPEGVAVRVEDVALAYGKRAALRGVGLEVRRGELYGLLGPNGGGKTTLFTILATLLPPDSGRASVFGLDVVRDAAAVRRRIGVVFQSPSVDPKLTVVENLRHQGHLYGLHGADLRARIERSLERFGLAGRAGDRVERLSGGLRRRVEIAKGLLHRPEVLLLDEPTVGLDPGSRRDLWAQVAALRAADGITVLVTTHLLDEAERCDRLAIVDGGRVVAEGTPAALVATVGGEVVTVRARDPESLRDAVRARFGADATIQDGAVRVEADGAHAWVGRLVEEFAGDVESVTVARPTLEDVFLHRTGHRLWGEREGVA